MALPALMLALDRVRSQKSERDAAIQVARSRLRQKDADVAQRAATGAGVSLVVGEMWQSLFDSTLPATCAQLLRTESDVVVSDDLIEQVDEVRSHCEKLLVLTEPWASVVNEREQWGVNSLLGNIGISCPKDKRKVAAANLPIVGRLVARMLLASLPEADAAGQNMSDVEYVVAVGASFCALLQRSVTYAEPYADLVPMTAACPQEGKEDEKKMYALWCVRCINGNYLACRANGHYKEALPLDPNKAAPLAPAKLTLCDVLWCRVCKGDAYLDCFVQQVNEASAAFYKLLTI
jgi:hypothetical protein